MTDIFYNSFDHPTAQWWLACSPAGLAAVSTSAYKDKAIALLQQHCPEIRLVADTHGITRPHVQALMAMLSGETSHYSQPLDIHGTPLQLAVWRGISWIPYGQTLTYAALAIKLDKPSAFRAVANACGANPVPLAIPCHRVVGSDGSLRGFGLGVELKKKLLAHEAHAAYASRASMLTA